MAVKVIWYGHACFLFDVDGTKLLMDPFISDNPQAPVQSQDVTADYILVSHGHGDHLGDAVEIAKRSSATVISNFEIHTGSSAKVSKRPIRNT